MKIRRLHEIDLARITTRSLDVQTRELRKQKSGFAPFSYKPLRKNFTNIVDAKPPMFPEAPSLDISKIEELIQKDSKRGDVEFEQNFALAELLYSEFRKPNVNCIQKDFYPVMFAMGHSAAYWANCVVIIDGQPNIIFFDQRRQKGLNSESKKFVFSMMHQHIREQFPDLYDAGLIVGQFPDQKGERILLLDQHDNSPLYSFDELNEMITKTYGIWADISSAREEEAKHDVVSFGPLFG